MKITPPPMPDVVDAWVINTSGDLLEQLLLDRDDQWAEIVRQAVEAERERMNRHAVILAETAREVAVESVIDFICSYPFWIGANAKNELIRAIRARTTTQVKRRQHEQL